VVGVRVPGGIVRVSLADDDGGANHRGGFGAGVVEEHSVALLHLVSKEVAGLIIPDAVPLRRLIIFAHQV
jgi:hypothetical protein